MTLGTSLLSEGRRKLGDGAQRRVRIGLKHGAGSSGVTSAGIGKTVADPQAVQWSLPGSASGVTLGRVLINRPVVSAFGQTGHRADMASGASLTPCRPGMCSATDRPVAERQYKHQGGRLL
jgi:hypothetical protein